MPRRAAISNTPSARATRSRAAVAKEEGGKKSAAPRTAKGKGKARDEDSEDGLEEPTGMTSDEESDSDLSDASAFDPDEDEDEDDEDVEAISVVSVSDDGDDDAPPAKRARFDGSTRATKAKPGGKAKGKVKVKGKAKADEEYQHNSNGKRLTALGEEIDDDSDLELEEGQEVIGRVYPAPKNGKVPPGRISRNTMAFLEALMVPEQNDREWFRSHEPAFRQAEAEFRAFVDVLQVKFNQVDDELPILPSKDLCHRIYRDVRFATDKTPYKCNFACTYKRSGRKGMWAGYHLYLEPGYSLLACGLWCPEKDVLQRFRDRLLAKTPGPGPLRAAIGAAPFVKAFGKPERTGRRVNVFGHNDELKVAPKGVPKDHKDIDLLRLRTFAVVKQFTDEQVLDPHFVDMLQATAAIMAPFVHTLNDYIAPP